MIAAKLLSTHSKFSDYIHRHPDLRKIPGSESCPSIVLVYVQYQEYLLQQKSWPSTVFTVQLQYLLRNLQEVRK